MPVTIARQSTCDEARYGVGKKTEIVSGNLCISKVNARSIFYLFCQWMFSTQLVCFSENRVIIITSIAKSILNTMQMLVS